MRTLTPWHFKTPARSKYGNVKCVVKDPELGEIRFDSKREMNYWIRLRQIQRGNGGILMVLRQVPFDLPGGVKYRLDFLVLWSDGRVQAIDAKGMRTQSYAIKKKQVEALYGFEIEEV